MIINHNLSAMFASRFEGMNTKALQVLLSSTV